MTSAVATIDSIGQGAPAGRAPGGFLRDVLRTVVGNLASPIIGIATSPILAHSLGVDGRGAFAAATTPTLLLTLAATLGLPEAATYFVASRQLAPRAALWRVVLMSVAIGALTAVLVWACAPLISTGDPGVTRLLRLGALTLPAVLAVGAIRGVAAGLNLWRLVNAEKLLTNGSRLIACLLFFALHMLTLPVAVAIYLGCPVLGGLTYFGLSGHLATRQAPLTTWSDRRGKNAVLLAYGTKTWLGALTGVVLSRVDQLLMAPLAGARELGFYAAAVAVGEIPYVVSGATRDVMLAADAADPDDDRAQRASRATVVVTGAVCLVLAALSPILVRIAFGSEFGPATPMLLVLLLAAFLYTPGSSAGAVLMARGRPGARSMAVAAACVANLAVLPFLISHTGGIGASLASVIGYSGMSVLAVAFTCKYFGWTWSALWRPTRQDARRLFESLAGQGRSRSALTARDGREPKSAQ